MINLLKWKFKIKGRSTVDCWRRMEEDVHRLGADEFANTSLKRTTQTEQRRRIENLLKLGCQRAQRFFFKKFRND